MRAGRHTYWTRERVLALHAEYEAGATLREVGEARGVSGEWVRTLFRRHGLAARGTRLDETVESRHRRGRAISATVASYGRDYLAECVRMAAEELGQRSVSVKQYGPLARELGLPSASRVQQVFGRWSEAVAAAGLAANDGTPPGHSRRFTLEDCLDAVRLCAEAIGRPPPYAEYERWQRSHRTAGGGTKGGRGPYPSAGAIRNQVPSRSWTEALRLALPDAD